MRLIDADALRAKIAECKAKQCSTNMEYVIGYFSAMSTVEGMIADALTIEAIPVEWLKQQFYDNPSSQWAEKCRDVFTGWQKWQRLQKEQEAQNGNM